MVTILVVFVLFAVMTAGVRPYTDWLWFVHDAQQPEVFAIAWRNRLLLFFAAFVPSWLLLFHTVRLALSSTPVFDAAPDSLSERVVANVLDWIGRRANLTAVLIATVVGAVQAYPFSANWRALALSVNGEPFAVKDPLFGQDLGFYVFVWPWQDALASYVQGTLFFALLLAALLHVGMQALASVARIELGRSAIRHLTTLFGLEAFAFAWKLWMDRYAFGLADNGQFTGAGYAATVRLTGQSVLVVLVALLGFVAIWNGRVARPFRKRGRLASPIDPFRPTLLGAGLCVLAYLVGIGLIPMVVQKTYVGPNYLNVEGPFAQRAITMTRFAYGLDKMDVRPFAVQDRPTEDEVAVAKPTLDNMRLWDPDVLRQSIEGLQGLRRYYTFHDVDIDRYEINGETRMVMLGARDVAINGLDRNARNWVNQRLQYTHGMGIVMTPVNGAETSGRPRFLIKDLPPRAPAGLELAQPRLYFSDFRDAYGNLDDEYAVVDTKELEFDYPSENETKTYRWTGHRGVPLGAPLARFAYGSLFSDQNLLISPNVTGTSRILYRRNVIERSSLIYPFLRFDRDPYVVLFEGKLLWILDGYTTASTVPYSSVAPGSLNYIRNSVKVTIDAYSGETHAYAVDPNEPVLRAWRRVYPKLILDADKVPAGLERHFRYPEDLFMLQAAQLTQYHVTDPGQFLNNEDAWEMPFERGLTGGGEAMKAYWVLIQLPGETKPSFLLILPFTPREKPNMSGWLAAHCDPERYGQLVLFKFPKGSVIQGPAQMESIFDQDREIADINRQFNNDQAQIVPGNLLVIPIGRSVLYVKPLFLQSRSAGITPIPELKKVVLAFSDKVVVGDSYEEALGKLIGAPRAPVRDATPPPTDVPPVVGADTVSKAEVREAAKLLEDADKALRAGDFAKYGELSQELKRRLEALAK